MVPMVLANYKPSYHQGVADWEEHAPSWTLPVIGFFLYALITMLGYFAHIKVLDIVGFITLMLFVTFDWIRKSIKYGLRSDIVTNLSLLGLIAMTVSALVNIENILAPNLIKYICLFVLYIIIYSTASPSLTYSPKRKYLLMISLMVVLVSLAVRNLQVLDSGSRYSGIFPNPNTFALFCFGLLFLISKNDMMIVKWIVHIIVLIALMLAGGSGALIAYAISLTYLYFMVNREKSFLLYLTVFILILGTASAIYYFSGIEIESINNAIRKVQLIFDNRDQLLSGLPLNWAWLSKKYEPSLLSGLWRVDHWRTLLLRLFSTDSIHILFGLGQGSALSTSVLNPPEPAHSDLVRFIYEVGIVGTTIILLFFYILFKRLEFQYKYVALAVFIYSLSENNFDNFLFMSIFIFILASNQENKWPSKFPISRY